MSDHDVTPTGNDTEEEPTVERRERAEPAEVEGGSTVTPESGWSGVR